MSVIDKLKEIKVNNTTRFVLPMLGTSVLKSAFFVNKFYQGAYIGDKNNPKATNKIVLFYKFEPSKEFVNLEKMLELLETYEDSYTIDSIGVIAYVFDIPVRYHEDYNMFINGDFSLFSNDYKRQILDFWGLRSVNIITEILYASTERGRHWPFRMNMEIY
jgi:hypothetical protein